MNLRDKTTEQLLCYALTGGDDRGASVASEAMESVADDLLMVENATKAKDASDYDYTAIIMRIAVRAEIAAELAHREHEAAKREKAVLLLGMSSLQPAVLS